MAVQREIVDKDGNRLTVVQGGAGKAAVYGKTVAGEWVPLQVDAYGRAVLNVGEVSATIGVVEQGAAGQDPWLVQLNGRNTAIAGKKTVAVAGTPEILGSQAVGEGVYIIAMPSNTGNVYVFPAAGTKTDVVPLRPGDSDFWPVSNISALKVDADVSGEGVYWKGAL